MTKQFETQKAVLQHMDAASYVQHELDTWTLCRLLLHADEVQDPS